MKCQFCQHKLIETQSGHSQCNNCPIQVRYVHWSTQEIIAIFLQVNEEYIIDLALSEQKCYLIKGTFKKVVSLNYLPKINPNNANHWLTKLLNLKAFS